jgi:hypothetical protein
MPQLFFNLEGDNKNEKKSLQQGKGKIRSNYNKTQAMNEKGDKLMNANNRSRNFLEISLSDDGEEK